MKTFSEKTFLFTASKINHDRTRIEKKKLIDIFNYK